MRPALPLGILASAFLLILSFPLPDAGYLSLVALVPLFWGLSNGRAVSAFLGGWGCGTAWFFVSYHWVSHSLTHYGGIPRPLAQVAIVLLAAIHGLYVGIFASLIPLALRRGLLSAVLILPPAWVILEVLRSWFPAPFPWLALGSALWKIPPLSVLYRVSGVYGASLWIVTVNLLLWFLLKAGGAGRKGAFRGLAGLLALTGVLYFLPVGGREGTIRVAVVQGNFQQELKWEEEIREETLRTYLELSEKAAREGAAIVVWPETALPSFFQAEPDLDDRLREFVGRWNTHLVFGSPGYDIVGRDILLYNRAWHLSPEGKREYYDKNQLVPFGEYVPLSRWLPFVDKMVPGEGEFARGTWRGPFSTPVPSGLLICYEVSFPTLGRREVRSGSDLLINVTNDAWFGTSWGPYQHLAVATVRAAENGVPLLRAANTGISAIIDERGRILGTIPLQERGILVADIPTGRGGTFYTRCGDWIVFVAVAVVSMYSLISFVFWRLRNGPSGHFPQRSRRGA